MAKASNFSKQINHLASWESAELGVVLEGDNGQWRRL
ncbi:MAG: hypothetical protein RI907_2627 [Pseudomonadota bacterium]|jgi:hypothetical protein